MVATAAVVFGVVGGLLILPSGNAEARNSAVETIRENVSSRSLYNIHCASCHGRDGRANTAKGRETDADDITGGVSTAKTIRVVTNGRGDMPGFKKKLSAAQIASIARYVATL